MMLGAVAEFKAEYVRTETLLVKAGDLLKAEGDFWHYAMTLIIRIQIMNLTGNYEETERLLEETERILQTLGDQLLYGYVLNELGRLAAHRGELAQAETYHHAALAQRTKVGTRTGIAFTECDLGLVNRLQAHKACL